MLSSSDHTKDVTAGSSMKDLLGPDRTGGVGGGADLDAGGDVVDDADGLGVQVAGQAVGDEVVLHLPGGLGARLLPVDGLTRRALEAAVLGTGR